MYIEKFERFNKGNIVESYKYDVLGRRIEKTIYNDEDEPKKIIRYTYSNQDIIQESTYSIRDSKEILKDTKEYVYGNKGIDDVAQLKITTSSSSGVKSKDLSKITSSIYYYQKNQLGSITAITDKDGKIAIEYTYDEFGKAYERKTRDEKWGEYRRLNIDNTRLFTSREYDRFTDLYYYRARYYSAELGRFISRDPIGQVDDINLYGYVGNSPVGRVDPMGLAECSASKEFIQKHDATDLLRKYMSDSVDELSFGGYFPKWGYSHVVYANNSISNKWNIKYNKEFQKIAYDPNDNNKSCAGYGNDGAGWCKVYVDGKQMELSEIGNFLIGYNGAYAGFTLNVNHMSDNLESNKLLIPYYGGKSETRDLSIITTDIYEAGMRVEFANYYNNNKSYETILREALKDELEDRKWYDVGYKTAANEILNKWGL